MKFWNKVSSFFNKAVSTVGNVANTVYKDVKSGVSSVFNKGSGLIGKAIDAGERVIEHGQDTVKGIADDARDLGSNLGSSLSMPLVLGALAIGAFALNKK